MRRLVDGGLELDRVLAGVTTVYTDLDGTLLGPGGSLFSLPDGGRTLDGVTAVATLCSAGIEIVPASGRNKYQLLEDARLLGLRHYVAEVGALVVHNLLAVETENLVGFPPAKPGEGTVRERIEATGAMDALVAAFPGRIEPHYPWSLQRDYSLILRGEVDTDEARRILAESTDLALDFVDNGIIRPREHGLVGCETIHAYHVLPRGVSKAKGVALERKLRDVPREQAIAIGDSASDVEVVDEVAAFFLVANGLNDAATVAAAADRDDIWVASAPTGAGWAQVAARLLAAKG